MLPKQVNLVETDPLHHINSATNHYNFVQKQINIKSQLNPYIRDTYLQDYWDKEVLLLIFASVLLQITTDHGFLESQETNHASAKAFPTHTEAYLQEEMVHGTILGIPCH